MGKSAPIVQKQDEPFRCPSCHSDSRAPGHELCAQCLLSMALAPAELPHDERFAHYEPVAVLGEGGMGVVYLAEQTAPLRRLVALKVLKPGLASSAIAERFERERQSMGQMDHPNIATVYDAGASERGVPWFAMEYVEGVDLLTHCDQAHIDISGRLELFVQLCRAVDYAHRCGILHRDLKPANILVTQAGGPPRVKVIDFGLARLESWHTFARGQLTGSVQILGTPEYMSPEQATGSEGAIGRESDIYSLGVVLYQLLCGLLPFDESQWGGRGIAEILHVLSELEPPGLRQRFDGSGPRGEGIAQARATTPAALRRALAGDPEAIVRKALEKAPARRYASAGLLADDIERHQAHRPVEARRGESLYRLRKLLRRHRTTLSVGASLTALAGALLVVSRQQAQLSVAPPVGYTASEGVETMPTFSPDGVQIAYTWAGPNGNNPDIWLAASPGQPPRRLTTDPANDVSPAWSPDGKTIAFVRGSKPTESHLMLLELATGQERELTTLHAWYAPSTRNLSWSPDGRWLAVTDQDPGKRHGFPRLYSPATGETRRILEMPDDAEYIQPSFSPDGRSLVFVRDDLQTDAILEQRLTPDYRPLGPISKFGPGVNGRLPALLPNGDLVYTSMSGGPWRLWRLRAGANLPETLLPFGENVVSFSLSRDASRLGLARNASEVDLMHFRLDAPERQQVLETTLSSTFFDHHPAISPTGGQVAFLSGRSGKSEIWLAALDGSGLRQVTSGADVRRGPIWLPDGRTLRYGSLTGGVRKFYLLDTSSGKTTHERDDRFIEWSDNKTLYFRKALGDQDKLYRAAAGDSAAEPAIPGGAFRTVFDPQGRWIYYLDRPSGAAVLWRAKMDGPGPPEKMAEDVFSVSFALTHTGVYFARRQSKTSYGVYLLDPQTRHTRRLFEMPKRPNSTITVSPDNRELFLDVTTREGTHIWVAGVEHW